MDGVCKQLIDVLLRAGRQTLPQCSHRDSGILYWNDEVESVNVPSHGATFGSTCFATRCTTKRLRSTIQNNFTGYDELRVLSYVAIVATPKQWIPSINISTDVHYAV